MFGEQNNKKKIKNGEKIKANKKDFNGNNHHGSSIHLKFPPAKFPLFFLENFFFVILLLKEKGRETDAADVAAL
jgi:hypothetical protein